MESQVNDGNSKGNLNVKRKNTKDENGKKPFDKKTYRLKKYSNKYKVNQWEERRKKAVINEFYRKLGKDGQYKSNNKVEPNTNNSSEGTTNKKQQKRNAFVAAKMEYQRIKDEALRKKQEKLRQKAEREEALQNYRKKKQQKFVKMAKMTKKGQPVMKGRLELLLEKIENSLVKN